MAMLLYYKQLILEELNYDIISITKKLSLITEAIDEISYNLAK